MIPTHPRLCPCPTCSRRRIARRRHYIRHRERIIASNCARQQEQREAEGGRSEPTDAELDARALVWLEARA